MTKPFIVAEMSANHGGSLYRALEIVRAAAEVGASAIKLQTYTPESMVGNPDYVIPDGPWAGQRLIDLYREAQTPWRWHKEIFDFAKEVGIVAFSSPFDFAAVDFLESLNCPIYKISSFELVDLPLIQYVAQTRKPMIMSTGMAIWREVEEAVHTARANGCRDLTLLKCTSAYPAPPEEMKIKSISWMANMFGCDRVGISDHSPGIGVAVAAVAFGATVIEKHLTMARSLGGPDASFSLEPDEFARLVTEVNAAYAAINCADSPVESERPQKELRRSLYFTRSLSSGEPITIDAVRTARPALGLAPRELSNVVGRVLARDVKAGDPVSWEVIV